MYQKNRSTKIKWQNIYKNSISKTLYEIIALLDKLNNAIFQTMTYEDVNEANSDFTQKVSAVDQIAPMKEICIKNNTEEWVDEEIFEGIRIRDKCFRKFKTTRLHTDDIKYRKSRNRLQDLIKKKKRNFVTQKLNENIAKPKELWKCLKSLGLPSKKDSPSKICLNENNKISF